MRLSSSLPFVLLVLVLFSLQHPVLDKYLPLFHPGLQRGPIYLFMTPGILSNDFIVRPISKRAVKHLFFETRQCLGIEQLQRKS